MSVFVSLVFLLLGLVATAQDYQRPKPATGSSNPPTNADLVSYDGSQDAVVVQIVNMTPFNIQLKDTAPQTVPALSASSITSANETAMMDTSRTNHKSFMFAPVGVPRFIPGVPRKAFQDLEEYDPNYVNNDSRSYSMLFSWDDMGGYVADSWIKWTVKDVEYCTVWDQNTRTCVGDTGTHRGPNWSARDVDLGVWMYRNKPTTPATSKFFPEIADCLKVIFRTAAVVIVPESAAAWVREILGIVELGADTAAFLKENAEPDIGNKMYLASYPVPHPQSMCVYDPTNQQCTPTTMTQDATGDGVYSLWADEWAAPCPEHIHCPSLSAEGNLVVTAHLLRGHTAPYCPPSAGGSKTCEMGSVPVFMVTVMRTWDFALGAVAGFGDFRTTEATPSPEGGISGIRLFLLQAGAGRIWALLDHSGQRGLDALRLILQRLSPGQRLVLTKLLRNMGSGALPTHEERELIRLLAAALQERLK